MWIVEQVKAKKQKSFYAKLAIWILIFAWSYGYYSYNKSKNASQNVATYKTFTVKYDDLQTSMEADWKVHYSDYYSLAFPVSWTIKEILKKEWDNVVKWDIIAKLDDTYYKLALQKAQINLKNANANLSAKIASKASQSDINVLREQVASSDASLDLSKSQEKANVDRAKKAMDLSEINLKSAQDDLANTKILQTSDLKSQNETIASINLELQNAKNELARTTSADTQTLANLQTQAKLQIDLLSDYIDKYIKESDYILWITDENKYKNDSFETYLWAKNTSIKTSAENSLRQTISDFSDFKNFYSSQTDVSKSLDEAISLANSMNNTLDLTLQTLKNSIASTNFTDTTINSYISSFEWYLTNLKIIKQTTTSYSNQIDTQIIASKDRQDTITENISLLQAKLSLAQTGLDKIWTSNFSTLTSLNNKLQTAQTTYEQAKIAYNNAVAKANNSINLSSSQVSISQANLQAKKTSYTSQELAPYYTAIEEAKRSVSEAQARLDDTILKASSDGTISEIDGNVWEQASRAKAFANIINAKNIYIESYVEETDIQNVKLEQKVNLSFDAIEWLSLTWRVAYISDKSSVDTSWIVSYKVKIKFDNSKKQVKEWMTANVDYITNELKYVLVIPLEAVSAKQVFSLDKNALVPVQTWFANRDFVQITSGLKEGEKIRY